MRITKAARTECKKRSNPKSRDKHENYDFAGMDGIVMLKTRFSVYHLWRFVPRTKSHLKLLKNQLRYSYSELEVDFYSFYEVMMSRVTMGSQTTDSSKSKILES